MLRIFFLLLIFQLQPRVASANDIAMGPLLTRTGEFKVLGIEHAIATCDMFDANGAKIKTESRMPPGCLLNLESIKEEPHIGRHSLGIFYAYSSGAFCKKNNEDRIQITVTDYVCNRPTPGITRNKNYCDVKDFEHPKKITNEQWACMIGGRTWLIKD